MLLFLIAINILGRIAFATDRDGDWEIYTMLESGTGLVNLTRNSSSDFYPAWSPSGERIAFFSYRDGNAEIYVMNGDGEKLRRLTRNEAEDKAPA
ncbi:MAG: PD40 domain-containing protein, partial [Deltaproteobacteria bacterium]|nr:PD40 domain-containing protein [Deltaproteobacteria bacterium]